MDPCAFSPNERQGRFAARFFAHMFTVGETVLDIGFGQGYFLEACREAGVRSIGIDRDKQLVLQAQRRGLDAHAVDVRTLGGVVPARVDGVLASHLVEHLTPPDLSEVLSALAERVRPGGLLVLVTPNFADWQVTSEWFWLDPTHVRPYPPGAIRQLIRPEEWQWDTDGYEPMLPTMRTPLLWANRLRFGRDYGRPGRWYRLRRVH
jgi:2-polyprenyl-3-methyl-5-hydroxy-6-metoxy-1,4-benzoquinol methylase